MNIITGEGATSTPRFMLKIGKKDVTDKINRRLISLTMTDEKEFLADALEIVLDDSDGLVELPERGVVVSLYLGWLDSVNAWLKKGSFIVDQVSHTGAPDKVTITGRSIDFRQKFSTINEGSWHDTTLGNIVSAIAERNSLGAVIADSLKSILVSHIDQSKESDIAFLTRLGDLHGGRVSVKDGMLLMLKAGSAVDAFGKPLPQRVIQRRSGDAHTFAISDRGFYTGVIARWLDTKKPKQNQQVNIERKAKAQTSQTVQHPNAKAVSAQTAAKKQKEQEVKYAEYMSGAPVKPLLLDKIYASKTQAEQAAESYWKLLQRRTIKFTIVLARGDESFSTEMVVRVSGFKKTIDEQSWLVNKLTHKIDHNGFVTTVELELNNEDLEYVIKESESKDIPIK